MFEIETISRDGVYADAARLPAPARTKLACRAKVAQRNGYRSESQSLL
jgi:hypothetical protein